MEETTTIVDTHDVVKVEVFNTNCKVNKSIFVIK